MIRKDLKKVAILFMASMVFGGSLIAGNQLKIYEDGTIKVMTDTLISSSLEGSNILVDELVTTVEKDVTNLIKINDKLVSAKNDLVKAIEAYKIKNATNRNNNHWAFTKGLDKLNKELSAIDSGLDSVKTTAAMYQKQGVEIYTNAKHVQFGLKTIGHSMSALTIGLNLNEMNEAHKSGDDLRLKHKTQELIANISLISGTAIAATTTIAATTVAPVAIVGGIAIGVGSVFNDMTEDLKKENKEWARDKIVELDTLISNDELARFMSDELKKISKEPITYTKEAITDKLNKTFDSRISGMLTLVNSEMNKLDDRRLFGLIRNEGELAVYQWLETQKEALERIKTNAQFGEDAMQITAYRKQYIDDVASNYIELQNDYLDSKSENILNILNKINEDAKKNNPIQAIRIDEGKDENPIALIDKEEKEKLEPIELTNPDNQEDVNKEKLARLEALKSNLENKLASIDSKSEQAAKLKAQLISLQSQLNNTDEYIYKSSSSSEMIIDKHKNKFLLIANAVMKRNEGVQFEKWSQRDQELFSECAIEIGTGRSAKALYNEFKIHGADFLKNKYAITTNSSTSSEKTYNDNYRRLSDAYEDILAELVLLNKSLTAQQTRYNELEVVYDNLNDDYNDEEKAELAISAEESSFTTKWGGNHTRVFFQQNEFAEPVFGHYGDSDVADSYVKPANGTTLELIAPDGGINGGDKTLVLNKSEAAYFGDYDYVAWGAWSDTQNYIYTSHWVAVGMWSPDEMPQQGTATYNGELKGGQWTIGQTGYNSFDGDISLNADFGTKTISGNLEVRNASTGATWASASINNGQIEYNHMEGQLVGTNISNQENYHSHIDGLFGGPNANEVGGVWAITKGTGSNGDERAVGVFKAKQ